MEATATETAGLRCPPETPPDTRMPNNTPRPHLKLELFSYISFLWLSISILPPVDGEKVSLCPQRQYRLGN